MINWRKILSWKTEPQLPKVGDKVRIIADSDKLRFIGINMDITNSEGTVKEININSFWGSKPYNGNIKVAPMLFLYPLNAWKDFLEIIG